MYPSAPVGFSNHVKAGDHMTGSVTYASRGRVTLKLADTTGHWSRIVEAHGHGSPRATAGGIPEGSYRPPAHFATLHLGEGRGAGRVRAGGEGRVGPVGGSAPRAGRAGGAVHGVDVGADPQLVPAVHDRRIGGRLEREQEGVQPPPGALGERGAGSPLAEVQDDGLELAPPVGQLIEADPGRGGPVAGAGDALARPLAQPPAG